jgi:hypothetical protein
MSHFSCVVFGEQPGRQLQKFHEFECTGTDDEYVQDIDITASVIEGYASKTVRRIRLADGTLSSPDEHRFYREATQEELDAIGPLRGMGWCDGKFHDTRDWGDGKGYRTKIAFAPEDTQEVEVPCRDIMSLRDYVEYWEEIKPVLVGKQPNTADKTLHKYGYFLVDVDNTVLKVVKRTNPLKRWDWRVLGGRWTGFFKLKDRCDGIIGKPGAMCKPSRPGWCDQCPKGSVDMAGMLAHHEANATAKYHKAHAIAAGRTWLPWQQVRDANEDRTVARETYGNQPAINDLKASRQFSPLEDYDAFLVDEGAYVLSYTWNQITPHAYVLDGEWHERGSMGFWGIVHDEQGIAPWGSQYRKAWDSVPDETLVSLFDCHI